MTTTIITLDDMQFVDVNKLFNFNFAYEFELLKMTVQCLIRNQAIITERLLHLENANVEKQYKIEKTEIIMDTMNGKTHELAEHLGNKDSEFKTLYEKKKKELEEKEKQRIDKIPIPKKIIYINKSPNLNNNFIINNNNNTLNNNQNIINNVDTHNNSRNQINNNSNNNSVIEEKSKTIDGKSKDINNNLVLNSSKDLDNDSWIVNVTEPLELAKKIGQMDRELKDLKFSIKNQNFNSIIGDEINFKYDDSKNLIQKVTQLEEKIQSLENEYREDIALMSELHTSDRLKGGKGDLSNYTFNKDKAGGGDFPMNNFSMLEKKIFKKLELSDENFKKAEEDRYKIRNDLFNLRSSLESLIKIVQSNKDDVLSNINKLGLDFKNDLDNLHKSTQDSLNDKVKELTNYIDSKFIDVNGLLTNNHDEKEISSNKDTIELDDKKKTEENKITKRVNDLEKSFKLFTVSINIEHLNKELAKINNLSNEKVSKQEYQDLKELFNQHEIKINYFDDTIIQLQEDRKINDQLSELRTRINLIYLNLPSPKNGDESSVISSNKNSFEHNKYLDIITFNDFSKHLKKELEGINTRYLEKKSFEDEIIEILKIKVNTDDLKSLEDFLINKLEEFKIGNVKKFADKMEVSKNIRYLDTQIKHILDVYIKKMEKGDNWLIAKKPLNGYTCASCEQYLGDLHENNQYIPWNKITNQNDKIYRVGSGFSKMLQMLNTEGEKDDLNSSKFKNTKLPRVKSSTKIKEINHEGSMDISSDNKDESPLHIDPNRAKVVKIYKKKKKDEAK